MSSYVSRVRRTVVAKTAALLIRSEAHRWCPPALSLRVYRAQFGGGRPDWSPVPGGVSWRAANGTTYGVDVTGGNRTAPQPLVIWIHGGGWFFGTRGLATPYLRVLSESGVTGLAPSYPLAPEARHPEPLHALNDGIGQLLVQAEELGFDASRVVLAGDSAGAALALALATAAVDPARAAELHVTPTLGAEQVRGLVVACGVFSLPTIADAHPWYSVPMLAALVSLARSRDWERHRVATDLDSMAVRRLPPTLVVSAFDDPLHAGQSALFLERLEAAGIDFEAYVAPSGGGSHEFQFELDRPSAQQALDVVRGFVNRVVA